MKISFLISTSFLVTGGVNAMRPASFDSEYTVDATSGIRLVSTNDEHGGYSTSGVTKVFGADSSILYEMPVFTGRRDIYLSPDGSTVVLDGGVYFGSRLMKATATSKSEMEDQVITTIYYGGKLWRNILYETDLNGPMVETEFGGGWATRPLTLDVSWDRNVLTYNMENGSERYEFPLPTAGQATM